ncbi:MAG: beta-glucosidase, partial [Planctomycetes bacterium]|nr:beta-glucosidase [Planctomycetota bacterium]
HFYHDYSGDLWGQFGFHDAFNLTESWFSDGYLAIDQGTIVPMLENYRTELCWDLFMDNPEIQPMLDAIEATSP